MRWLITRSLMAPLGLVFLLCLFNFLVSSAERNLVSRLPGYEGALPFRLETGYVSVDEDNGAELFYYFIESESDPRRDPVLLWLTGGDRCTVFSALAFEIGPVKFIREPYNGSLPRLEHNPYTWTKAANILFVDSPVGAGFSFSKNPEGYDVGDLSTTLQLKKFLRKWFEEHQDLLTNPFYVGGDSYGGKIVPYLVEKISEDIEGEVKPSLNLKGYLVGNPATGESIDDESKVPYAHGVGIISDQLYEEVRAVHETIKGSISALHVYPFVLHVHASGRSYPKTIMEHCQGQDYTNPGNLICAQSLTRFDELIHEGSRAHILYKKCIYVSPGKNDESARRTLKEIKGLKHPPPRPPMDCQSYVNYLSYFWANSKDTRHALGIKKGTKDEWVRCHDGDLPYSKDIRSSIKYHRNVTLKGYRALVYSGDHDLIIPFLGTQAWVRSLNFSIVDDWRAWHLDGQSAGFTISYSNKLTFTTVKGGGHTAPEFEPERCLAMFTRWISNKPI